MTHPVYWPVTENLSNKFDKQLEINFISLRVLDSTCFVMKRKYGGCGDVLPKKRSLDDMLNIIVQHLTIPMQ